MAQTWHLHLSISGCWRGHVQFLYSMSHHLLYLGVPQGLRLTRFKRLTYSILPALSLTILCHTLKTNIQLRTLAVLPHNSQWLCPGRVIPFLLHLPDPCATISSRASEGQGAEATSNSILLRFSDRNLALCCGAQKRTGPRPWGGMERMWEEWTGTKKWNTTHKPMILIMPQ